MTATTGNLFTRDDTMFGICEALGEDLGFNPNLLRVTLAVLLLWNPVVVLASYFGAGVVVLASRLAWPNRRKVPAGAPVAAAVEAVEAVAEPMKLAA
jgi:phage shock protein PspC (stress-responsive transcriptional regulator)